jgi:hypothetical protein
MDEVAAISGNAGRRWVVTVAGISPLDIPPRWRCPVAYRLKRSERGRRDLLSLFVGMNVGKR